MLEFIFVHLNTKKLVENITNHSLTLTAKNSQETRHKKNFLGRSVQRYPFLSRQKLSVRQKTKRKSLGFYINSKWRRGFLWSFEASRLIFAVRVWHLENDNIIYIVYSIIPIMRSLWQKRKIINYKRALMLKL